jgi:outer membrane protein OmpA-like peptidoglycan-associated protein
VLLAVLLALTPATVSNGPAEATSTVSEVVNIDFTATSISSGTIANAGAQSTGALTVVGSPLGSGTADGLTFANTSSGSPSQYLTGSLGSTVGITQLVIEMVAKFPDSGCAVQSSGSMVFALGNSNAYNVYRHSNFIGYNTFNSDIFGVINTAGSLDTYRSYKFVMTPIPDLPSAQEIWIDGVKQGLDFRTTSSPTGSCSAITGTTESSAKRVLTGTESFLLMTHSLGVDAWRTSGTIKSLRITKTTGASTASAPTIGSITAADGSLSVAYTGSASNGGAAITNYEYSIDDGVNWVTPSPASTTSPLVIPSLTNGTTYPVKLRARNSAGAGTASTAVNGTPVGVATTPGAATISAITAGDTQLSVAFTAPGSNGGAPITNYDYSIDNGSNWITPSPASTTSPLVITGLTNSTAYPVKIRARNSVGAGTASNGVSGTPAAAPPSPPPSSGSGSSAPPAPPSAEVAGVSIRAGGSGNSSVVRIKLSKPPVAGEQMFVTVRLLDLNGNLIQELKVPVNSSTSSIEVPVNKAIGQFNAVVATSNASLSSAGVKLEPEIIRAETMGVTKATQAKRLLGTEVSGSFTFTPNSWDLSPEVRKELRAAAVVAKSKNARVAVTGFAAISGLGTTFERYVAERRALEVSKFLRSRGVESWIYYRGLSGLEGQPFPGDPRRVEIRTLK